MWRRKFKKELIKETEMTPIGSLWYRHIMRRNDDNIIKTVMSQKPTGEIPRGRPRKRWMNVVEEDLKRIEINDKRNIIHDREK